MTSPVLFWAIVAFVFGISIGSFLNVVIYRLNPKQQKKDPKLSLLEPRTSICPSCGHPLSALDLVPLFSFLLLGQRCRYCRTPISWRYFNVELLTGLLFVALYLRYPQPQDAPNCIALLGFSAVLIPVFFIDLASFEIPTSLNILLLLIPLARDVWGIAHHEPGHALLWGWLPPSILGALVGGLIFGIVRVAGWLWKGIEAMGLGDVLLGRGMGAMLISIVPPGPGALHVLRLFPIWVFLACLSGIVAYPLLSYLRRRNELKQEKAERAAGEDEAAKVESSSLIRELSDVGWCLVLGDCVEYIYHKFRPGSQAAALEEDDWQPAATAIPFGPFLVIGFLLTVFVGEPLTAAYLAYALNKQG